MWLGGWVYDSRMTVAVAVNAVDSIVLASDSAPTQQVKTSVGQVETINIWSSANKIFNMRKAWSAADELLTHLLVAGEEVLADEEGAFMTLGAHRCAGGDDPRGRQGRSTVRAQIQTGQQRCGEPLFPGQAGA